VTATGERDTRLALLRARVRDVPDFPRPGILFRDLTPLMGDGVAMGEAIDLLAESVSRHRPELVIAIESRGFIFGAPVAASLGIGFVPVRKPGKLPHKTRRRSYALEYGTASPERVFAMPGMALWRKKLPLRKASYPAGLTGRLRARLVCS
jgi:adenine phosphoribosyltransferase